MLLECIHQGVSQNRRARADRGDDPQRDQHTADDRDGETDDAASAHRAGYATLVLSLMAELRYAA